MLYNKEKNKVYLNTAVLKKDFPVEIAEGEGLSSEGYPEYGVLPLIENPPVYNTETQRLVYESVEDVLDADGNVVEYKRIYSVRDKTQAELDRDAKIAADNFTHTANRVRSKRDELLANTDWMVIKALETSVALPDSWSTYRQALRDITDQTGFPHNINWPSKPE